MQKLMALSLGSLPEAVKYICFICILGQSVYEKMISCDLKLFNDGAHHVFLDYFKVDNIDLDLDPERSSRTAYCQGVLGRSCLSPTSRGQCLVVP